MPPGGNGVERDTGECCFHVLHGADGDSALAANGLATSGDDVQFALPAVETFMDDSVEGFRRGSLEFLRDFPARLEETIGMAAADKRGRSGEVFPVIGWMVMFS